MRFYTRLLPLILIMLLSYSASTAQSAEQAIRKVMAEQQDAWNAGDIPQFMEGYWKSDKLQFVGSKGVTYGWDATLANYLKGYPDKATMGTLTFTLLEINETSRKSAYVIGKWELEREKGNVGGHFTLIWRKIKGEWRIVVDHTS
ncbi:MAG: nuclear transport factor 2 family protein [Saprospiraceae bacterium]